MDVVLKKKPKSFFSIFLLLSGVECLGLKFLMGGFSLVGFLGSSFYEKYSSFSLCRVMQGSPQGVNLRNSQGTLVSKCGERSINEKSRKYKH